MATQWEHFPYGQRGEFVDVDGLGRYAVRPEHKGSRTWRAYLNNKSTTYTGTRDQVKAAVERVLAQRAVEELGHGDWAEANGVKS